MQKSSDKNTFRFSRPAADVYREKNGVFSLEKITADSGRLAADENILFLSGNVRIESEDGAVAEMNELQVNLK